MVLIAALCFPILQLQYHSDRDIFKLKSFAFVWLQLWLSIAN